MSPCTKPEIQSPVLGQKRPVDAELVIELLHRALGGQRARGSPGPDRREAPDRRRTRSG